MDAIPPMYGNSGMEEMFLNTLKLDAFGKAGNDEDSRSQEVQENA